MQQDNRYKRYIFFGIASLALFMSSVDSTIVATALSSIQHGLNADLNWTGWTITAYQLISLTVMPLMGRISDEWGRKRIFLACVVIFTLGSLLAGLATNIYWLIFYRALQALGGGSFMPSAVGIVGDHFHENRAKAIGLFTSIFPLGGIIGPALGGWLIDISSWRYIFFVNLPIGIVVIVLAYFLLEPDPQLKHSRVDFLGSGLFAAMLLSFMYFMTYIGEEPARVANPETWVIFVISIGFLVAFIRRESRVESPVLDIALLKSRSFAIINGLNLLYGICIFGLLAFIPYYSQVAYGMSNLASGTLLTARALGMMGMATLSSMVLHKTGYRLPMALGFTVIALSILGLSPSWHFVVILGWRLPDFWWLAFLIFISGIGVGMASPSSNNAAIELMPDKISAISGLRGMFRQSGGVLGTSTVVLVLSLFPDKINGFHYIFLGMTFILLVSLILIRWVPNGLAKES